MVIIGSQYQSLKYFTKKIKRVKLISRNNGGNGGNDWSLQDLLWPRSNQQTWKIRFFRIFSWIIKFNQEETVL